MGNGYAVTAVIGKRKVMEVAQKLSSAVHLDRAYWVSRRIENTRDNGSRKIVAVITKTGNKIATLEQLAIKKGLEISLTGIPAISGFSIGGTRSRTYKTLITQKFSGAIWQVPMFLFALSILMKFCKDIDALEAAFSLIEECENGRDVQTLLKGPICHDGFRRLNEK